MRDDPQGFDAVVAFFSGIFGMFTRNWGLKLFSLALAILIYYTLKPADGMRKAEHDRPFFHEPR